MKHFLSQFSDKHERVHSEEDERHKTTESSKYREDKAATNERRDRRESGRPERGELRD